MINVFMPNDDLYGAVVHLLVSEWKQEIEFFVLLLSLLIVVDTGKW